MKIFVGDNEQSAVLAAAEDLQADIREVCGENLPVASYYGYAEHPGFVVCTVGAGDERLIRAKYKVDTEYLKDKYESFIIQKCGETIVVLGSDVLGTLFGVYHICEHFFGVDPLRFWTDMAVEKMPLAKALATGEQKICWGPPAIRYRGWFVNEDDLIRQFDYGSRKWDCDLNSSIKQMKSPYVVTNPAIYEGLIGTLLRLKQNLLLAGTYVCPLDTLWKEVMAMAARRGLYNTTQHFQPLGCWPTSFYRYWDQRGKKQEYSWLNNRQALLDAWEAFAAEMVKYKPVWQVGYRGRDDTAFWETEAGAPESVEGRGAVISEAIAAQVEIAKKHDPNAVLTYYLWAEGDPLYRSGHLTLPKEVTVVFSDYGRTSIMKEGFWQHTKQNDRRCGVYYHLGFWSTGPTDNMGITPEKIDYNMRAAFEKGTTDYLMVNIASVREHLLSGSALAQISAEGIEGFDPGGHYEKWCGHLWGEEYAAQVADLYRRFFEAIPRSPAPSKYPGFPKLLHDGCFVKFSRMICEMMLSGEVSDAKYLTKINTGQMQGANMLGVEEEGADQGFWEAEPKDMYFQTVDEVLAYVAETSEKMVADLLGIEKSVDELAKLIERKDAGRFLRSHVAGQAAYMRILGSITGEVARAALALKAGDIKKTRSLLEEADRGIDKNLAEWYSYYTGRFESWPRGALCVNPQYQQECIRQILDTLPE